MAIDDQFEADRLPRSRDDDYSTEIVDRRRKWLARHVGAPLASLNGQISDTRAFRGNIENLVGTVQIPTGIAGPYRVRGQSFDEAVFVPMATTEGALVASYSRGMKAISLSGGARTRVLSAELTAGCTFLFAGHEEAGTFAAWLQMALEALQACANSTTRHGRLLRIDTHLVARRVFANFIYDTADALGINMATRATAEAVAWIAKHAPLPPSGINIPGGMQGEKWANGRDFVLGRGRRVVAEATLSAAVLHDLLRTDARTMHEAWLSMVLAKMQAGGLGASFHAANGIAAVMLATGQDMAYLAALTTIATMEALSNGDLYVSVDIPTLGVGTVGGGTGLPSSRACLEIMRCTGPGGASRLAQIAAATAVAGEASTVAAIVSGEFVHAHETLGRNRPAEH